MFTFNVDMILSRSIGNLKNRTPALYVFKLSNKTIKNPEVMIIPEIYCNVETRDHYVACYINKIPKITKIPDKYVPSMLDCLDMLADGVSSVSEIVSIAKISEF